MRGQRLTRGQVILLALAAVVVAVAGFNIGARTGTMRLSHAAAPGAQAPDFSASTLDEVPKVRTLADYSGDVVVLNLWATWCGPCQQEMPSLERLHRTLAAEGLRVVGVSVDDPGFEDRVSDFVARFGLTFEVLTEGTGEIERLFQSPGLPMTIVIDRNGIIRERVLGAEEWDTPERVEQIRELLAAGRDRNVVAKDASQP